MGRVVASGYFYGESEDRRLFLDEARRRLVALLEDLHFFSHRYSRRPPAWLFERLAAVAALVVGDNVTMARLSEALEAVEVELRNALAEMAAALDMGPVTPPPAPPLEPIPAPATLRQSLTVIRGGRA